ncbi:hypothetical protein HK102_008385 [Quaeritorhiza haematococci]|nr:hypothetical protein HK102_008385 [Quaeritorhiza haematococci]
MVEWFSLRVHNVFVVIIWTIVAVSTIVVLLVAALPRTFPQNNDAMFFGGVAVIISQVLIDMFINIVSIIMVMRIRLARITALRSQITSGLVVGFPGTSPNTNPKIPIAIAVAIPSQTTSNSTSSATGTSSNPDTAASLSTRNMSSMGSEGESLQPGSSGVTANMSKTEGMSTTGMGSSGQGPWFNATPNIVLADPAVKWASFMLSSLSLTLVTIIVFLAICILLQSDLAVAVAEVFGRVHYAIGLIFLYCLGYVLHPEEAPVQNPWVLVNPKWWFSSRTEKHGSGGGEKRDVEAVGGKEGKGGEAGVSELKVHVGEDAPHVTVVRDQWKITNVWETQVGAVAGSEGEGEGEGASDDLGEKAEK